MAMNSAWRVPFIICQGIVPGFYLRFDRILHCYMERTYIERPIRIIHSFTNNLAIVNKDTSNWYFIRG